MIEQNEHFKPRPEKEALTANPELVTPTTSILRIVAGEKDPETGEVFAEFLYFDDLTASNAEDNGVITPLVGYDPQEFPEDIRDAILAGRPFEVTSIEVQSPDDAHIVDYIETFSLVEE